MFQEIKGTYFILLCVLMAWEELGEVSAHQMEEGQIQLATSTWRDSHSVKRTERHQQSKTIVCFQIYYDNFTFGIVLYTELNMSLLLSKWHCFSFAKRLRHKRILTAFMSFSKVILLPWGIFCDFWSVAIKLPFDPSD